MPQRYVFSRNRVRRSLFFVGRKGRRVPIGSALIRRRPVSDFSGCMRIPVRRCGRGDAEPRGFRHMAGSVAERRSRLCSVSSGPRSGVVAVRESVSGRRRVPNSRARSVGGLLRTAGTLASRLLFVRAGRFRVREEAGAVRHFRRVLFLRGVSGRMFRRAGTSGFFMGSIGGAALFHGRRVPGGMRKCRNSTERRRSATMRLFSSRVPHPFSGFSVPLYESRPRVSFTV